MEKLIKMWQMRQKYYEDLAEKNRDSEHNFKKFKYKGLATRDCWKELLAEIEEQPEKQINYISTDELNKRKPLA